MNESREHILKVSLTLFLQKSFKEVTLKDIVTESKLSKGAFYHYFSSKEQVFAEVIEHFFSAVVSEDYSRYSQHSLKQFYTDVLEQADKENKQLLKLASEGKDQQLSTNIYFLIFDAMKMLPDFKQQHQQQQKEELKAWKNIIGTAILHNEIDSPLNVEQIARLFINLSDGANISMIMSGKRSELKALWDNLYQVLRARN